MEDHVITTNETKMTTLQQMTKINNKKKENYIIFLDATKAYEKAFLDAINICHKQSIKTSLWTTTKKLIENLTATVVRAL